MIIARCIVGLMLSVTLVSGVQAEFVTYAGSSTGQGEVISASVQLELVGYDFASGIESTGSGVLKLTVTNTAPLTTQPANLLTGVFLTVNPDLTWGTTFSTFDGLAPVVTTKTGTTYNVDIAPAKDGTPTDGGWALTNGGANGYFGTYGTTSNPIDLSAYNVGLTTIGGGYPGVKGKDLGPPADNYGIYSASTTSLSNSLNQQLPLIQGTAIFYLKPTSGLTSLGQITGVAFAYGSTPSYLIHAAHMPVPSGMVLTLTGIIPFAFLFRRLRRQLPDAG